MKELDFISKRFTVSKFTFCTRVFIYFLQKKSWCVTACQVMSDLTFTTKCLDKQLVQMNSLYRKKTQQLYIFIFSLKSIINKLNHYL